MNNRTNLTLALAFYVLSLLILLIHSTFVGSGGNENIVYKDILLLICTSAAAFFIARYYAFISKGEECDKVALRAMEKMLYLSRQLNEVREYLHARIVSGENINDNKLRERAYAARIMLNIAARQNELLRLDWLSITTKPVADQIQADFNNYYQLLEEEKQLSDSIPTRNTPQLSEDQEIIRGNIQKLRKALPMSVAHSKTLYEIQRERETCCMDVYEENIKIEIKEKTSKIEREIDTGLLKIEESRVTIKLCVVPQNEIVEDYEVNYTILEQKIIVAVTKVNRGVIPIGIYEIYLVAEGGNCVNAG